MASRASTGPSRVREIVVAYKHTMRVRRALEQQGVRYGKVKCDLDLGLCLVPLDDDIDAAERFQQWDPKFDAGALEAARQRTRTPFAGRPAGQLSSRAARLLRREVRRLETLGRQEPARRIRHRGTRKGDPRWRHPLAQGDAHVRQRTGNAGRRSRGRVLDTSVASHQWLAGGWSCSVDEVFEPVLDEDEAAEQFEAGTLPNAVAGHATFVAGLILQEAPGCLVRVHRVLSTDGEANSWQVAREFVRLAKSRPDVINLSLVCYTEDGEPPLALATAIDRIHPDTVVVAAAGNHGDVGLDQFDITRQDLEELRDELALSREGTAGLDGRAAQGAAGRRERMKPTWPAAMERVIAIGSGLADGKPSVFTPKKVGWIDALADGESMPSTFPQGGLLRRQGRRGRARRRTYTRDRALHERVRLLGRYVVRGGAGERGDRREDQARQQVRTPGAAGLGSARPRRRAVDVRGQRRPAAVPPSLGEPRQYEIRHGRYPPAQTRYLIVAKEHIHVGRSRCRRRRRSCDDRGDGDGAGRGRRGTGQRSMGRLMDRYVRSRAWSRGGSAEPGRGEGVTRTVWLRLVEHLDHIREPQALPGWIATTTGNESSASCAPATGCCRSTRRTRPSSSEVQVDVDAEPSRPNADRRCANTLEELAPQHREALLLLFADPPCRTTDLPAAAIPKGSIRRRARAPEQLDRRMR